MTQQDIRYSRQISLGDVGAAGQQRLRNSSALIIGAGGLGSPAALYLANAGVGRLLVNDFDTVDVSNLPRQVLYTDKDIGRSKAAVAAERLHEMNPDTEVTAIPDRLDRAALNEHIASVDVVLDCTDNFPSRWRVNEVCAETSTALVSGAAIRTEGQLCVFRHDQSGGPCYRCLYSEEDENLNDCVGQGILGPVAGTIGCMMATETIKFLLAIASGLDGKLWIYDAKTGNSRTLKIPVHAACPVCNP
jgi:molybdopterin/thiamine biosynthesis adenylyltransferase